MRRGNRGQVLVILAISLFALLGMVALAVDLGYLWSARHELQRCADAGALAGASSFIDVGPWDNNNLSSPAMVTAESRAKDYASKDVVARSPLNDNEIVVGFPSLDRVQVTTSRTVPLFFARIFGRNGQTVSATAIAEAGSASNNVKCLKPWGISYPWNDNNQNGLYDPGEEIRRTCPDGTDPWTDNTTWYFCTGTLVQIKVSTKSSDQTPVGQQEPSHFFELDLGQLNNDQGCEHVNEGASSYLQYIKDRCLDNCFEVSAGPDGTGSAIPLQTGNDPQKTIQGAQYLIDQDPLSTWTGGPHPTSPAYGDNNWMDSPRVVRIPIYDPTVDQLSPGSGEIHVAEFAGMWIERVDPINDGQGTVYGRYISASVLGGGTGGGTSGTPSLRILRLVK